ncbi:DEAD/DEAH box helicase [Clostridium grantii]|uniref:Superfamily II DNA or RNA helicase, SNF2 family n=1 Tax=Clostridium grantii DSM 8605 TaxID=1121316 RepID=A0A1M5TN40_9CLOT|nr:SNF2-related protein [Clostridium grantii]SHH52108.1 Superfamily II DNA or RNA helicase, SNF2 family [Clostridium grantii DSM 8605]
MDNLELHKKESEYECMYKFLFKLNKDLLDLNAIELDDKSLSIFNNIDDNQDIIFINQKDEEKKFKINKSEKLINGRGIKTFFKKYSSEYIFMELIEDNKFKVHAEENIPKGFSKSFVMNSEHQERLSEILNDLNCMKTSDEKWFDIYHKAQSFSLNTKDDKLMCLPYLRELQLFDYQLKTVKSAINRFKGRVLFCDEVGLGKTIEAGMTMMEYVTRGLARKILILVPPSLVEQWYTEMKRKFNLDFIKADDAEFKSMGDEAWNNYDKVIASINTAKRKNNSTVISKIHYDLVIVDEAHHLKNRNTIAWKFINTLNKKYIFLLTATPVQNKLDELYNLITLLKPGQLKTYSYFKNNFVEDKEGIEAKNVDRLRSLLSGVMIRNKRSDVDIKFTKRKAITYSLNLSVEEQKLYDEISNYIRKIYFSNTPSTLTKFMLKKLQEQMGSSIHSAVSTLDKYSENETLSKKDKEIFKDFSNRAHNILLNEDYSNSKINQVHKIITELNDKVLIFTKYKATQKFIVDYLKNSGFLVAEFHGGLKRKEKEEQVTYFKEKAQIFVCTEAGGEGRNLQFCNAMINYDLPWNPMAIEQRIGRIHRVGQTRDVFVYNLASQNTVEYYILELLDKKINMFELVVGEVDMILGDIEEDTDFSEIIMNTWINSKDMDTMNEEIEKLGEQLLDNKRKYIKMKDLDDKLFGNSFKSDDI